MDQEVIDNPPEDVVSGEGHFTVFVKACACGVSAVRVRPHVCLLRTPTYGKQLSLTPGDSKNPRDCHGLAWESNFWLFFSLFLRPAIIGTYIHSLSPRLVQVLVYDRLKHEVSLLLQS